MVINKQETGPWKKARANFSWFLSKSRRLIIIWSVWPIWNVGSLVWVVLDRVWWRRSRYWFKKKEGEEEDDEAMKSIKSLVIRENSFSHVGPTAQEAAAQDEKKKKMKKHMILNSQGRSYSAAKFLVFLIGNCFTFALRLIGLGHEPCTRWIACIGPHVRFTTVLQIALALGTSFVAITLFVDQFAHMSFPEFFLFVIALLLFLVHLEPVSLERLAHVQHSLVPVGAIDSVPVLKGVTERSAPWLTGSSLISSQATYSSLHFSMFSASISCSLTWRKRSSRLRCSIRSLWYLNASISRRFCSTSFSFLASYSPKTSESGSARGNWAPLFLTCGEIVWNDCLSKKWEWQRNKTYLVVQSALQLVLLGILFSEISFALSRQT